MIDSYGRYGSGTIGQVYDKRSHYATSSKTATTYVYRNFEVPKENSYIEHSFRNGDRLDIIASKLYGDPKLWAKIMDLNPEIADPFYIKPGTVIRLPID